MTVSSKFMPRRSPNRKRVSTAGNESHQKKEHDELTGVLVTIDKDENPIAELKSATRRRFCVYEFLVTAKLT